ncbi:MAG: hypothetical protein ABIW33_06760 [Sphingomicrobium sp.]
MQFRVPRPLHGWREFLGEVGIIVIGVLIALGAQQVIETMHSRSQAAAAEQRIKNELAGNSADGVERLAVGPCLTQRIATIATGLAGGRTEWSALVYKPLPQMPTALGEIYHKPSRNWVMGAYHESIANGDLDSIAPERRGELALNYSQIAALGELNNSEQDLSETLAPLQFNPTLSQAERNQMIVALARLDLANGVIMLVVRQTFQSDHRLGLEVPADQLFTVATAGRSWPEELASLRGVYGNCVDATALEQYQDIAVRGAKAP